MFTQQQYESLIISISQGVLTVRYGDKLTQYRTLEEMLKLKDLMEQELGINAANDEANKRRVFMKHSKGLKG
ncbi:MAG: hypothetical protein BWY19_00815 [bacterium ADurb.Bin212]|nr:MAG: hypothetical protein BWY19_00815 [bacterium ADurb.Bin212]